MEKNAVRCLSDDAKKALTIINDVLATNSHDSPKDNWEMSVGDRKFNLSQSLNAAKMSIKWDE